MVAEVKIWLFESSSLIDNASLSVMVLKSSFLYFLFTTKPFFTRKATPSFRPVEWPFLIAS